MDPVIPQLPEDLASLSSDELATIQDAAKDVAKKIAARDEETLARLETEGISLVDAMTQAVGVFETAKGENERREKELEEENNALAEALAKIDPPEPTEEAGPEDGVQETPEEPAAEVVELKPEEPVAISEQEPEAIAASGKPGDVSPSGAPSNVTVTTVESGRRPGAAPPAASARYRPVEVNERAKAYLVASGDSGLGEGKVELRDVAQAMKKKRENFGRIAEGTNERITIARIESEWPEERTLDGDDQDKISDAIGGPPGSRQQKLALTASGGLCAPVNPYYELQTLAQADRPVRDALVGFNATRGGIRYAPPASLASIKTDGTSGAAVGRITMSQDASNQAKTFQHIGCPSFVEVDVAAIYHVLEFGNIGARAWPEQVANFTQLAMAAWARTAETALLDGIESACTKTTGAQAAGANATLVGQVLEAAAAMRNRHRMDPDAQLRLLMPAWTIDLMLADSMRTAFPRYPEDDAGLAALFAKFNVTLTMFWDASTTSGNLFGGQTTGIALNGFPPTVDWYLFPEGSFLFVDSGSLELGIVRDSTLNSTNDYQVFGESWENVAFIGVEALRVRSTVCDTGGTGIATSISCGSA